MAFPINEVRAMFPSLAQTDDGAARCYLDNPAGTQVSKLVIDAVSDYFIHHNSNSGGAFVTSRQTDHSGRR